MPAGAPGCQSQNLEFQSKAGRPSWKDITENQVLFKVIFDMQHELKGKDSLTIISKDEEVFVRFLDGKWLTSKDGRSFHLFDSCSSGGSDDVTKRKVCIHNLVLTYEMDGAELSLDDDEFEIAETMFGNLNSNLKGQGVARVEWPAHHVFQMHEVVGYLPCNVHWSNILRFDPSDKGGKCLMFNAATKGTLFVIFSAIPAEEDAWYYIEISPYGVGIFKVRSDNYIATIIPSLQVVRNKKFILYSTHIVRKKDHKACIRVA